MFQKKNFLLTNLEDEDGQEKDETLSPPHKFVMVDWEKLQVLFKFCFICGNKAELVKVANKGTMVKVTIQC